MKKKLLKLLPYIVVLFVDFDLLPFLIPIIDSGGKELILFFMLFYMPLIAFITSLVCGVNNSFSFILPIVVFFLLILQMFSFMGYSFIYGSEILRYIDYLISFFCFHTIIHTVIVFLGVLIGQIFRILFKSLCKHLKK